MDIGQLLLLGLQILIGIGLAPVIWRLSTVAQKVSSIEERLGNGAGVQTRCALHDARITRLEIERDAG